MAIPSWDPLFADNVVAAQEELVSARNLLDGTASHRGALASEDAIRHAHNAITDLTHIMGEFEDVPESILDTIDGAIHESHAVLDQLESSPPVPCGRQPISNDLAMRIDMTVDGLTALLDGATG